MEIMQIVGLGIIATILIVILKESRPEFAVLLSIVTGVIIFLLIVPQLVYVVDTISSLSSRANVDISYFNTIVKIIGMAYLVEFASQISRDAGQDSIAMKIELGGKVLIMVLAIPILLALMDLIIKILP
ncbi:stage III sporulation protein AD [Tissierella creatinini]|nr:stage III sporulation protein AD [Tissierella creatinini]TJX69088.1 stage III sporulation protein AD [Soehngenia saccharolytica]